MATHGFYIALAYGVSAALLLLEILALLWRWRRLRQGPALLRDPEGDAA
jgi:heme exporter protein CcmD